jgi:Cu2+-exporting ATPase
MIHGSGLDRYYRLREDAVADAEPARTTDRQYGELDDPVFRELYYQSADDGTVATELYLEGVHCAACVWLVEKLPQVVPGVLECRLEIRRSLVHVRWDDDRVKLSRIARSLDSLGYPPHPARDVQAREMRRREDHRFLIRIGVAAACAGNVMTLSFALYGGVFTGIEAQYSQLFRWASMVFGLVALAWPGSLFFRGAWAALRTRTAHLDLPIALGLLAGGIAGSINAVLGRGEIYFDSLTMLVFLLLVGRWIQGRQQRWASDAIELLFSLTPTSARRIEEDQVRQVPIEAIRPGDLVEVRAGESIPTDGTLAEGRTRIDESLLTGESLPTTASAGDRVHAGTLNLGSRITMRVDAVGERTRVGRLMRLVEQCSQQRAAIVEFADRVAGWFVIVVITLALLTFAGWLWWRPSQAIDHAVALLIVTCPCALGLATPLAVTVALGRAAKRGILIKGGQVLEYLARGGRLVLDKTGTLTAGRTTLVRWVGDRSVGLQVAALESHSAHPIAQALVDAFPESESSSAAAELLVQDVQQTTGGGLAGRVQGRWMVVGSPAYVRSAGIAVDASLAAAETELIAEGATPVLVGVEGRCVALAGLNDPIREDVEASLRKLASRGWQPEILSGDHPDVVRSVALQLGIPAERAIGGASPELKLQTIQHAMQESGQREPVVMVGDGVNDAAALSAASVGIAVHGGAEASLAAADVYLSRPGLAPIVELTDASRNTLRTIRRSLAVSLCYNAIAATLAMAGLIGPLVAAILMPISSFTVLTLAYASRTFGSVR